jgi:restriction system protein
MARRRNEKSPAEAAAGLVMMIVALAILSPVFRGQLISTLSMIIAVVLMVGVVGLVIYLLLYLQKEDVESRPRMRPLKRAADPVRPFPPANAVVSPARSTSYTPVPIPVTQPQHNHEEQARIQDIIQSMQSVSPADVPPSKPTTWTDSVLAEIEWKRFEIVTREFLRLTGYEAHETNVGADGGVDIRVTKPGSEGKGIVQCKAWNTYKVGVKPVRELFGVMAAEHIGPAMFITSGSFTSDAEDFAKGRMTLVSGKRFLELIRKLPEDKQQKLLEVALEGDYSTPTCPQCDIKMVMRESKKDRSNGGQFWGCPRYPRCKQTLVYKT